MSSEKAFEKRLRKTAKGMGYLPLKLNPNWIKGIPDRLFVGPNRAVVFMELKTPIGRASKLQKFYIALLKKLGFAADFVDGYDRAIEMLESARLSETGDTNDAGPVSGGTIP